MPLRPQASRPTRSRTAGKRLTSAEEGQLLVPDNIPIPDLDTEEKRKGKGIPESAIIVWTWGNRADVCRRTSVSGGYGTRRMGVLLGQEDAKLWVSAKFFE